VVLINVQIFVVQCALLQSVMWTRAEVAQGEWPSTDDKIIYAIHDTPGQRDNSP
jgi:hypothetical protein